MNKFYLTITGLILVMASSLGTTVFYLHNKQSKETNTKLIASLQEEGLVPNKSEDLSEIADDISEPNITIKESTPTPTKTAKPTTIPKTDSAPSNVLTLAVVATHSTKSNCWIMINSKVYNVTNFLNIHPGGVSAITSYCGKDATDAFNSNSMGHNHSSYARSLLPTYFVVNVGSTATITPTPLGTSPTQIPRRNWDDDDD